MYSNKALKKDKRIGFVMTEKEFKTIKEHCEKNDVQMSEFCRKAVLGAINCNEKRGIFGR